MRAVAGRCRHCRRRTVVAVRRARYTLPAVESVAFKPTAACAPALHPSRHCHIRPVCCLIRSAHVHSTTPLLSATRTGAHYLLVLTDCVFSPAGQVRARCAVCFVAASGEVFVCLSSIRAVMSVVFQLGCSSKPRRCMFCLLCRLGAVQRFLLSAVSRSSQTPSFLTPATQLTIAAPRSCL